MTFHEFAPRLLLACALASLAGCGGLKIKPLTKTQAEDLHSKADQPNGYVVYAPMLVVEVTRGQRCTNDLNKDGQCPKGSLADACLVSAPKLFPDYDKPFLVNIEPGFGKATIEVAIADGWRLGTLKSETDNTEVLKYLVAAVGGKVPTKVEAAPSDGGKSTPPCETGIFRWTPKSVSTLPDLRGPK